MTVKPRFRAPPAEQPHAGETPKAAPEGPEYYAAFADQLHEFEPEGAQERADG